MITKFLPPGGARIKPHGSRKKRKKKKKKKVPSNPMQKKKGERNG